MFDPRRHMHPDVEDVDLVEIADYNIASDDPAAAIRVLSAVRDTFIELAIGP